MRRGNAFLTPEWFRCWREHHSSQGDEVAIATARGQGGDIAGLLPLTLAGPSRRRRVRLAGSSLGDHFHPIADEADETAVAAAAGKALREAGHSLHKAVLVNVDAGAGWPGALGATASRGLKVGVRSNSALPFIPLAGLDWDGYLATRSSKFRKRVRYEERALRRLGELSLRASSEQTLTADMEILLDLHERRWQGRASSALAAPGVQPFLRDFARLAQRNGWLRLHCLELDGEPVAALLGWRLGPRYAYFQSGFDPSWARHSVGTVLVAMTIRSAIEEGAGEFDMLLGTEAYKRRFAEASRPVETVVMVSAAHPARLATAGNLLARRSWRRLAASPRAGPAVRRLADRLPSRWRA